MFCANCCLDGELFVHFSSPFIHCSWCTLFANKVKSRVLRILKQEAILLRVGSSTQKGPISPDLVVLSTRFAFHV